MNRAPRTRGPARAGALYPAPSRVTPREEFASLLASLPLSDEQRRAVQTAADALAIDAASRVRRAAWDSVQRHMHAALEDVQAASNAVDDEVYARPATPKDTAR